MKDEVVRVAERYDEKVFIVSNGGLRPHRHPLVESIYVAEGPDVADDWIAERAADGDIVITADIPLAHRCVTAGASVLKPNGSQLDTTNIGSILATRNLMADLRDTGAITSRVAEFTQRDRSNFLQALDRALRSTSNQKR